MAAQLDGLFDARDDARLLARGLATKGSRASARLRSVAETLEAAVAEYARGAERLMAQTEALLACCVAEVRQSEADAAAAEAEAARVTERARANVDGASAQHTEAMAAAAAAAAATLSQTRKEHEAREAAAQKAHRLTSERLVADMTAAAHAHAAELAGLRAAHADEMGLVRRNHEGEVTALSKQIAEVSERLAVETAAAAAAREDAAQRACAHEAAMAEVQAAHAQQASELSAQSAALRLEASCAEKRLAKAQRESVASVADLKVQVESVRKAHAAALEENEVRGKGRQHLFFESLKKGGLRPNSISWRAPTDEPVAGQVAGTKERAAGPRLNEAGTAVLRAQRAAEHATHAVAAVSVMAAGAPQAAVST
jgi:hypothetical protein